MSRGLNKVQCIGHLGRDPESRTLPSGGMVTNFSVAATEGWTNRETGEKMERTEWFSVTCFGKLAEIAAEYLTKGKQVYIEGRQRTEKWQDKEGNDRYSTKLYADQMILLGGGGQRPANAAEMEEDARQHRRETGDPGPSTPPPGSAPADFDDDIPF
jgi:single-strand DNA-binding protein